MDRLLSKSQSQKLDEKASFYGLSPGKLMEKAGFKVAEWLLKEFPPPHSFALFCGPGHNGGDAFVTAVYLKKAGREVELFSSEVSSPLSKQKKKKAQSLGIKIKSLNAWEKQKGQVLIDALFGVGLSRPLEGLFKDLVLKISQSHLPVVSLDIPSGLCTDTGKILGLAIKAKATLTFALAKPGLYLNEGPEHAGQIVILPIGFPEELLNRVAHSLFLVQKQDVRPFIPSYKNTANKSHRGWSLIIAGSKGMWGAGLLACRSAYVVGSGYVTWAGEHYPYEKSLKIPEALLSRLDSTKLFYKKTAVGAGPGLGFSQAVVNFLKQLTKQNLPTVLDADVLSLLAQKKLPPLNKNFLLTPHAGELSRLLDIPSHKLERDRLLYARQGAKKYNSWLLFKGFHPVLSNGEKCWILHTGNSALGKAGTGDVLTGILTSLMAQGLSLFKASLLGTFLQGESARLWIKEGKDINSLSASDIVKALPFVIKQLRPP